MPGLGVGFTAGLTSRSDIAHRLPFPIVLPLVSVNAHALTLYATLIPRLNGLPNNGNVVYLFARYSWGR